jgi:hypothetical protein
MGDNVLEAEETQADVRLYLLCIRMNSQLTSIPLLQFLFLRQLGQDASSVRLTDPLSLEDSETSVNLICISNTSGLLFAATNEGERSRSSK